MIYTDIHKNTPRTSLPHQWFTEFHQMGETHKLEIKDYKGQRHFYEWVNGIALNGTKDADNVNYFEYTMFKKAIKQLITTAGQLIFQPRKTILSNWLKAAGQDGRLETKHLILLKTRDITLNTISVIGINTWRIIRCFSIFSLSLRTRYWNCRILYIRYKRKVTSPCFCHTIAIIMTIIIYMIRVMYYVA